MGGVYLLYQFKAKVFGTLHAINEETKGLVSQLQKHQESVDKMPGNFDTIVSKELSQGLEETNAQIAALKESLQKTFNGFESLVQNFPHLDAMPQWLAEVKDVIVPMKAVSNSVAGLDEKILARFNMFIEGRGKIEESFIEATQAISNFTSEVGTHRVDIHDLVRSHLDKINTEAKSMQEPLAQIASFSDNNERLFTSLGDGLPKAIAGLQELIVKTSDLIESARSQSQMVGTLTTDWQMKTKLDRWIPKINLGLLVIVACALIVLAFQSLS
jgi:uncharacterized phage infection (PIP) family protein YhgE